MKIFGYKTSAPHQSFASSSSLSWQARVPVMFYNCFIRWKLLKQSKVHCIHTHTPIHTKHIETHRHKHERTRQVEGFWNSCAPLTQALSSWKVEMYTATKHNPFLSVQMCRLERKSIKVSWIRVYNFQIVYSHIRQPKKYKTEETTISIETISCSLRTQFATF